MSPQRLVLHAGTPKTGTTALQRLLARNREAVRRQGVLYPDNEPGSNPPWNHRWIADALRARDEDRLIEKLSALLSGVEPSIHTVVLSTEGLFNHWWDFSEGGRRALGTLGQICPVELWVWFRDPVAFARSFYVQSLRNPPRNAPVNGRDISIEEALDDPWFARHLDYIGFVREVERVLGEGSVVPFAFAGDTVDVFLRRLGLRGFERRGGSGQHRTAGELGIGMMRAINRCGLGGRARRFCVDAIGRLDPMLGPLSPPLRLSLETERRIRELAAPSLAALEREFGLALGDP